MKKRTNKNRLRKGLVFFAAVAILGGVLLAGAQFGKKPVVSADTPTGDTKSVIVHFKNVSQVTGKGNVERQQAAIDNADQKISEATSYSEGYKLKIRDYENLPYSVYIVDAAGEQSLKDDPNVADVSDNELNKPGTYLAVPTIGGSTTTGFSDGTTNFTGAGFTVAILDTGVESTHSMLSGKVVSEACFNTNATQSGVVVESRCPGGATSSTATGSAADCDGAIWDNCGHGTAVASIAAGLSTPITDGGSLNEVISGSALGADILGINVFSKITSVTYCGSSTPCVLAFSSDYVAALDYVISLANANTLSHPIAAVNMSLGSTSNSTDDQATCSAISNVQQVNTAAGTLKNFRIATVIATGNDGADPGQENRVGTPGCAVNAIAVGATNRAGNTIASYSNNGPLTDLLAPGGDSGDLLVHAATGDSFDSGAGTSYATPLVSGAFAVLRDKHPNASVDSLLSLLQTTGTPVTDNRAGYTVGAKPRINLATALVQSPLPAITSFTGPSGTVNEGAGITLTAAVTGSTACSLDNGVGSVTINAGAISETVPGAASYTLTCVNAYGDTTTDTLSLTVNTAPTIPAVSAQQYDEANGTYTISWDPSTDTDGIQEYRVYLNGQLVATLPAGTTTYTAEGLLSGVAYSLEVRAVDTLGAISSALSVNFGAAVPGVPNTGAFALLVANNGRGILVAALGLIAAIALVIAVKRKANQ
ncbi:MAG: S8 family serine peptidase [Candidatus Microsaccharimonas sp.]